MRTCLLRLGLAGLLALGQLSAAPTHEVVLGFQAPPAFPTAEWAADGTGSYWSTSQFGGTFGAGAVFRMRADGSEFSVVLSFNPEAAVQRGANPRGPLVLGPDGAFYGTTTYGGTLGFGTVFRVALDGTLTTLVNFTSDGASNRGAYPLGGLVVGSDGQLYGTTSAGGAGDFGTVFRVSLGGTLTTLAEFDYSGGAAAGATPYGTLVQGAAGVFYGTTQLGGAAGFGTVFRVTSGGVFTTLFEFQNTGSVPGAYPQAGLRRAADGSFYGCTYAGGAAGFGTVFRFTDPGALTTLIEFTGTGGARAGAYPAAPLCQTSGGDLYGTTYGGGAFDKGTIFRLAAGSGAFSVVREFSNTAGGIRGAFPQAGLLPVPDGTLLGTTSVGGVSGNGTLFRLTSSGTLTTLSELAHDGSANRGLRPSAGLLPVGTGRLRGTTESGGAFGFGTVFELDEAGIGQTVVDFSGPGGANRGAASLAGLTAAGGVQFGATFGGGSGNLGTLFQLDAAGALTTLVDFTGPSGAARGAGPQAAPVVGADGNLYGLTVSGGTLNYGTLYRLTPAGVLTTLLDFTRNGAAPRGSAPRGALLPGGDGFLYGTTAEGGAGFGTLFKVTETGVLTTLLEFTGAGANPRGAAPVGALIRGADGLLYGTTQRGGAGGFGTIFKVTTDGTLTTLVEFTSAGATNRGALPLAGLVQAPDGFFYGTAQQGGARDFGTVFRVGGSGPLTTLVEFTGPGAQALAGANPGYGALVFGADANLYGTTSAGGPGGGGTIYRLRFGPRPVTLAATAISGGSATLQGTVAPNGAATTALFEWGTSPTTLSNATTAQPVGSGSSPVAVSAVLAGLQPGTTYYYRMRGDNAEQFAPQRGAVRTFTTSGGTAPLITSAASTIFTVGLAQSFTVTASGSPTPTLAVVGALPPGVTFQPGTGVLAGTIASFPGASYALTFTADNGVAPAAQQAFTLLINRRPVAGAVAYGTPAGQTLTFSTSRLLAAGSDADGDALSVVSVSAASALGGAASLVGGTISYQPPAGFVGSDSLGYTLADGRGGTASGTVQIFVTAAGQPSARVQSVNFGGPSSTTLQVSALPGVAYVVQASDDLSGAWLDASGTLLADGTGALTWTDTRLRPGRRFYRLVAAP
ncbi:MAG: cadherin-like domain-containing protein [Verrucomicrobia bacterium]|nr:cadherin-like domain-containing protein [Verrucomicrobiota bacterium]